MKHSNYNEYVDLTLRIDYLVRNGMNDLDPVIRSIARKLAKLYKAMSAEEREWADDFIALPFR